MLTARQLDDYRQKLHSLRAHLDRRVSSIRGDASHGAGGEDAGGLSNAPLHLADLGNQEAEAAVNVELAMNEATIRQEIDEAIARLEAGAFGKCEMCQTPIPEGRLDALPYARFCIQCAERTQEQERF